MDRKRVVDQITQEAKDLAERYTGEEFPVDLAQMIAESSVKTYEDALENDES